jgi:DNA-binding CsgD family transcriptional regulator
LEQVSNEEILRLARKVWPRRQRLEANIGTCWADIYCQDAQRPVIEIRAETMDAPVRDALHAALKLLAGEVDPPAPSAAVDEPERAPALDLTKLSRRERDVVEGLRSGVRLSALARHFGLSQHTARNHLKHVFRKLGVHSQVELLARIGGTHA